jgi:hypothetical protein
MVELTVPLTRTRESNSGRYDSEVVFVTVVAIVTRYGALAMGRPRSNPQSHAALRVKDPLQRAHLFQTRFSRERRDRPHSSIDLHGIRFALAVHASNCPSRCGGAARVRAGARQWLSQGQAAVEERRPYESFATRPAKHSLHRISARCRNSGSATRSSGRRASRLPAARSAASPADMLGPRPGARRRPAMGAAAGVAGVDGTGTTSPGLVAEPGPSVSFGGGREVRCEVVLSAERHHRTGRSRCGGEALGRAIPCGAADHQQVDARCGIADRPASTIEPVRELVQARRSTSTRSSTMFTRASAGRLAFDDAFRGLPRGSFYSPFPSAFRFPLYALGELLPAGLAVPFLEGPGRDFAFDEELRELAALCLALERHGAPIVAPHAPQTRWTSLAAATRSSLTACPPRT